jgi:hypothetical protein
MDIIKTFYKNPRRFIADYSKNVKKVQKRKIAVISKFLWFTKKKQNIKNLKDLKHRHIKMYIEEIEKNGIWDRSRKQYRKISEKTLNDHVSILRGFVNKVKIE